jgi:hypothetical protein
MQIDESTVTAAIAAIEQSVATALKKAHPSDIDMWRAIGCDRIDGVMTLLSFMTPNSDGEIQRSIADGIEAQERIKRSDRPRLPTQRASHGAGILR